MVFLKQFNCATHLPLLLNSPAPVKQRAICHQAKLSNRGRLVAKCCSQEEQKSKRKGFLSLEEAGLVEISGLSTHERFLCRLTISSLNLLRVISEQEGVAIEELNAGRVCDWFMKDKLKREQDLGSAVLQWDDSDFQF
ncbi:uncharacterized protein LOC141813775 [Curcuma longa]|uniref:uncharacterized protein LOC141813775 n=1 Tax=Curcuma longa TaxID=136217 RepID=UPI003D9EFF3C